MQRQAAATDDSAATCRPGRHFRYGLAALAVCLLLPAVAAANPYAFPPVPAPFPPPPVPLHPVPAPPVPPPPVAPPVLLVPPARPVVVLPQQTAILSGPQLMPEAPAAPVVVEPVMTEPAGNLQIVIARDFIAPLVERNANDAGPIRDFILGADVFGEQSTNTSIRLVFLPCPDAALLQIELSGRTNNRTVGITPQAAIHSIGEHDFCITKKIRFDGRRFMTWSPSATVLPRQQNLFAQTPLGGIPLVGPVASNFALSEANRRAPMTRNIIAQRVTDQAAPRFNDEVDRKLAQANRSLHNVVIPRLQKRGLLPQIFPQTTRSALRLTLRLGEFSTTPPPAVAPGQPAQVTVRLHESFLNRIFDRLPLAGAEVTDAEIKQAVAAALAPLGGAGTSGADQPTSDTAPALATLTLDEERPLQVEFGDDRFSLVLRSAFQPLIGPRIDTQEIAIPYDVEAEEEQVRLRPQTISITPAKPGSSNLNAITEALLRQQVESRVPEITLPRTVAVPIPGLPKRPLRLVDLRLQDGWLVLAYE